MFDTETENAIKAIAKKNNIPAAALLAVVDAESSGTPFWKVGTSLKPAIRFEGHYFYARLDEAQLQEAIKQGLASKKVGGVKNPRSYAARYELLAKAAKINRAAAYESTSWGLGQVMGANWKDLGYKSVFELANDAYTVTGQVDMMVRFIIANDLVKYIKALNWAAFAKRYNGPRYKENKYDTKMATAYAKYSGSPVVNAEKDDVILMQKMLNAVGKYNLTEDGSLGNNTRVALRDYQLKNGLKSDGLYGPITREELEKDYVEISKKKEDIIGKIGASAGTVGTAVTEAAKQIEPLAEGSQILQYVFLGLMLVGIALTLKATIWK